MTIKTEHQATRVWVAYDDNTYDGPGSPIGWGETEAEAISDLIEQLRADLRALTKELAAQHAAAHNQH
jgi:hypothetical protein